MSEKDKSLSAKFKMQCQFALCYKSGENCKLPKVYLRVLKSVLDSNTSKLWWSGLKVFVFYLKK